jgi:hypothetical protein
MAALSSCKTMSYTERRALLLVGGGRAVHQEHVAAIPGALDIEPDWTQKVPGDEHRVELSPYPDSRVGACGFVG